ncbi:zinc finger protein 593 [Thecamonas trahens ATCC 50062]|uniref:Zinc finger protein 593 n=1 Tax=Thecamonas trahens ATCC 50062 TaxID=461836 RepID=A0A0L0D5S3_THETB|nr:zinc finger protein 593 [Thecamonas trahens ATCC 50062]KNC47699.1 zinc finger protein 593 [Thecamonas trahens ATCC 50062]|eukprot:XP_013759181.1 zinc finger protein 593 [Thecamonas trahens ATCC 50062]
MNQAVDYDLPGKGQFYCVSCAKHFLDLGNLEQHRRGKPHKRQLKRLRKEKPYTQAEADAAGGMGAVDNGKEGLAPGLPAMLDDAKRAAAVDALEAVTASAMAAKAVDALPSLAPQPAIPASDFGSGPALLATSEGLVPSGAAASVAATSESSEMSSMAIA